MDKWSTLKRNLMNVRFQTARVSSELCGGRLLVFNVFIFLITATRTQGRLSTCEAPPVYIGSMATVTCKLQSNLTENKFNVYVVHYVNDISKDEIVMVCKSSGGNIGCTNTPDYRLLKYESDTPTGTYKLITQISEVNQGHAGKYCCAVSWAGDNKENSCDECTLDVKEVPQNTPSSGNYTENGAATSESFSNTHTAIVALSLSLILAIIVAGIAIYCFLKHKPCRERTMDTENPQLRNSEVKESLVDTEKRKCENGQTDEINRK